MSPVRVPRVPFARTGVPFRCPGRTRRSVVARFAGANPRKLGAIQKSTSVATIVGRSLPDSRGRPAQFHQQQRHVPVHQGRCSRAGASTHCRHDEELPERHIDGRERLRRGDIDCPGSPDPERQRGYQPVRFMRAVKDETNANDTKRENENGRVRRSGVEARLPFAVWSCHRGELAPCRRRRLARCGVTIQIERATSERTRQPDRGLSSHSASSWSRDGVRGRLGARRARCDERREHPFTAGRPTQVTVS